MTSSNKAVRLMDDMLLRDELPYGPELEPGIVILHRPFGRSLRPHANYSLSALIHVTPLNVDLASDEEADSLTTRWSNLMRSQPVGTVIDIRLDSMPRTSVLKWEAARVHLTGDHIEWQRRHLASGMPHTHEGRRYGLRRNVVTIGLRTRSDLELPLSLLTWLQMVLIWRSKRSQAYFDDLVNRHIGERVHAFRLQLASFIRGLSDLGLRPKELSGQALFNRLSLQLDPQAEPPPYESGVPIRDQLGIEPVMLTDTGVKIGERSAHMLTPGRGINHTFPGILSAVRAPEKHNVTLDLGSLSPTGYFSVSVAVAIPDPGDVINSLEDRQGRAWLQRVGFKGQERSDVAAQEQELSDLIREVTSGEESLLPTGVRWQVWDTDGEMGAEFLTRLTSVGIIGSRELYVGSTLYLQSLSLGTDIHYPDNRSLQGLLSIKSTNAAQLTPLWGCFAGDGSAEGTLFLDRLGNPVFFDPFAGPGSPHGIIVGLTRFGKSAATNTMLHQLLPTGGYAFILDRYGSYEQLAKIHGGVHFSLSLDNPICLGLMDGPLDAQHRATVVTALTEMCGSGESGITLTRSERAILNVLVKRYSQRSSARVRTLSTFVAAFEELAEGIEGAWELVAELKLLLMPYYGDGEFAPFIDGPNELDVEGEHLVSVDIAGLLEIKEIEAVMVAMFFMRFGNMIRNPALRRVSKFMIADEVAFLLNSPATAKFFLTLSRALARFKCSLLTISQFLSDFDTEAGQVVVDMAGYKMVFRLNAKQKAALDAHGFNEKAQDLIYNLNRTSDSATCYIEIKTGETGVVRVVAPPEFLTEIGQDEAHQLERIAKEEAREALVGA